MNLFQTGHFILHSGQTSDFKIDCDALTDADLEALARQIVRRLPEFSRVEGFQKAGCDWPRRSEVTRPVGKSTRC